MQRATLHRRRRRKAALVVIDIDTDAALLLLARRLLGRVLRLLLRLRRRLHPHVDVDGGGIRLRRTHGPWRGVVVVWVETAGAKHSRWRVCAWRTRVRWFAACGVLRTCRGCAMRVRECVNHVRGERRQGERQRERERVRVGGAVCRSGRQTWPHTRTRQRTDAAVITIIQTYALLNTCTP
jgi:hypothetical protein